MPALVVKTVDQEVLAAVKQFSSRLARLRRESAWQIIRRGNNKEEEERRGTMRAAYLLSATPCPHQEATHQLSLSPLLLCLCLVCQTYQGWSLSLRGGDLLESQRGVVGGTEREGLRKVRRRDEILRFLTQSLLQSEAGMIMLAHATQLHLLYQPIHLQD